MELSAKEKLGIAVVGVVILGYTVKGCAALGGNKDILDMNKSFNIAIDVSEHAVSVVGITGYADYEGSQLQFVTQDGLVVLTSTKNTHLISQGDPELAKEYAIALANGDEKQVCICNDLVETDDAWNKDLFDLNYTYNYAFIKSEEGLVIAEVDQWRDYDDDKIQITLTNGTVILKDVEDVKLINSTNATPDEVYNYGLSLVGDESRIQYYSAPKKLIK